MRVLFPALVYATSETLGVSLRAGDLTLLRDSEPCAVWPSDPGSGGPPTGGLPRVAFHRDHGRRSRPLYRERWVHIRLSRGIAYPSVRELRPGGGPRGSSAGGEDDRG